MNSVVQSLVVFPDFMHELQKFLNSQAMSPAKTSSSRFPILTSLVKLVLDYEKERQRPAHEERDVDIRWRLERLKEKVGEQSRQFLSDKQQDAGEFFSFLMDAASEEIKKSGTASLVDEWIGLTTETRMTCPTCNHVSPPVETLNSSMYLAVPEDEQESPEERLDLQHLLTTHLQEVERRDLQCPKDGCQGREVEVRKTTRKLPRLLVIQLSRITMSGRKVEAAVAVSDPLSLSSSSESGAEYQLRSVICHVGPSITSGHYYAFIHNRADDKWYDCDDHEVREISRHLVCNEARTHGYCFFYEKSA